MAKKTIEEKILAKNAKSPPGWLYRILIWVCAILNKLSNTHFTYNARPAEEDGPIVMIANHASRVDYQFTAPPCYPKKLNYVVGYNEFFCFPNKLLLALMQVIPKKNFTPDTHTIRQILRIVKSGGSICIMPEGMSSITGMAQPVIPGGGKLIKKLGVPVYYSKIAGGYMTYTKHCLDMRKGRIDVSVNKMFSAEELKMLTPEEIEDRMNKLLVALMQVIPKKNFTPDTHTIRQIMRVIKSGGSICIMPEGMSSITGMAQPVIPGGGKLIKKLGLPVYYSKISGGYMTYTKHCLDMRKGRIEVVVDRMVPADELKSLTPEQIEDRMNRLLAHDDYMWNKEKQVRFNGKGQMAKNLGDLLYLCPKCGEVYKMHCEGNTMRCKSCGNTVELDECYNLRPVGDSECPELVTDWTIMERERAAKEVRKPDFSYSGHVKVGILPEYKALTGDATSVIAGEGELKLDHAGLHFAGVLEGKSFGFDLPSLMVPTFGMCTDITRFYTFVDGRFIEFYPDNNDVLLWDHLTEELHRYNGGKWQNTGYRHTLP